LRKGGASGLTKFGQTVILLKMENPCASAYPEFLPPPDDDPLFEKQFTRLSWRRTAGGEYYLADGSSAIAADRVEQGGMDHLFPRHAELFPEVVTTVLRAASSGFMNHYEAAASDQVRALCHLMASPPAYCSWAADAVEYLKEAGCYTPPTAMETSGEGSVRRERPSDSDGTDDEGFDPITEEIAALSL
jgi:hypothetical protein